MKLILNIPFITLNEYIKAERSNKYIAANIKRRITDNVTYIALERKINLSDIKHDIIFTWFKPNNKIDHDNISFAKKFILDGLVNAKVIKSDSPKYIGNFQDIFDIDKTRNYISCMIEFIECKNI